MTFRHNCSNRREIFYLNSDKLFFANSYKVKPEKYFDRINEENAFRIFRACNSRLTKNIERKHLV